MQRRILMLAPALALLPGWARAPVPVHAVFPSSRYLTPKLRAFIDLAMGRFPSGVSAA